MDGGSWTDIHTLDCIQIPVHLPLKEWQLTLIILQLVYTTVFIIAAQGLAWL